MTGLFAKLPRRPRIRRAHVADAGNDAIRFKCAVCGWDSGWRCWSNKLTDAKRGIACERCNPASAEGEGGI